MPEAFSPAPARPELSILVPFYNEDENVVPMVDELCAALGEAMTYELILVNDGSTDSTAGRLKEVKAKHPATRIIHHTTRAGKSAAVWTAFKAAKAPWVQLLDGDRQNDPADVVALWTHLHQPVPPAELGLVAGQRKRRADTLSKRLQSRIANRIRAALLNDATPDTGCGFKLIRREAMRDLPFFDGMHRFLPALVRHGGWRVDQYPVNDRPRVAGVSKYGLLGRLAAGIDDLLGVMWLLRRRTWPRSRTGDLE